MLAGLLAACPSVALAGPFDLLTSRSRPAVSAQSAATNQQIADQIAAALKEAKLKGFDISIEVSDGVATLSGKIRDSHQKTIATKVTSGVDGVVSVNNQLQLVTAPRMAPVQQAAFQGDLSQGPMVHQVKHEQASHRNQQVAQQIANGLVSAGLGDYDLEIRYKDGACSLIGALDTPEQAMAAYQRAATVPGVNQVLTRLTVAGREFKPESVHPAAFQAGMPAGGAQYAALPYAPQPLPPQAALSPTSAGAYAPPPVPGPGGPMAAPVTPAGYHPHLGHGPHFGRLGAHEVYNSPYLPQYAWPTQAAYDNYAAVSYPSKYDASAWPYIGPFYPYPQVPLGWRSAQLVWDDGYWNLKFDPQTDKWWWFLHPENWD
jgi:osmotically-inducible protein OsmY